MSNCNFCPYGSNSLWRGPQQYPYVQVTMTKSAYRPYVPWGRGMKQMVGIGVESPLPCQKHPCTCRDRNNKIPVMYKPRNLPWT